MNLQISLNWQLFYLGLNVLINKSSGSAFVPDSKSASSSLWLDGDYVMFVCCKNPSFLKI